MSQDDLQQLRRWRALGARQSENVVRLAQRVLQAGGLGDEEWPVREQLTIAALDLGQVKLANLQLRTLQAKFPKSPRADLLLGLKLEALEEFERARQLYQGLLADNECNVAAHQRLIALSPSTQDAIGNLLKYLDTFYSDAAAWSLLAELYASVGAYAQSLTALGHLLVLHTWDSQAVTRYAETADYQLALKYFLRATEMETPDKGNAEGFRTRSWWGVKQTAKRLLDPATRTDTAIPDDSVVPPAKLQKLEALATERILAVGGANMVARRAVLAG